MPTDLQHFDCIEGRQVKPSSGEYSVESILPPKAHRPAVALGSKAM